MHSISYLYHNILNKLLVVLILSVNLYPEKLPAAEDVIEIQLPNRLTVSARHKIGETDLPAVLILHGFLQTHNSATVNRLSTHLNSEGYTVLAPTLSLGVSRREKSLSCEAIHTHTMHDDVAEIEFWVNWLNQHNYKNIVIAGHSYGSLQLLVYLSKYTNPTVKKIIAMSLVEIDYVINRATNMKQIEFAKNKVQANDKSLDEYKISYCKKYISPARNFLTYADWSRAKIVQLVKQTKLPIHIILGSNDKRININWPPLIRKAGADVIMVKGANHFFDAEFEFDLIDTVSGLLASHVTKD